MSIDEVMKKSKLSLDEMLDNKSVGSLDVHESGHPTNKQYDKSSVSESGNKPKQQIVQSNVRKEEKLNCKITFNTSERLLDAFNELYAKRIIEKRKTDKSAILNEALELLLEKEKKK